MAALIYKSYLILVNYLTINQFPSFHVFFLLWVLPIPQQKHYSSHLSYEVQKLHSTKNCKIAFLKLEFSCLPWCIFALISIVQEVENHHPLLLMVDCVNEIIIVITLGKSWRTEHLIALRQALNKPKYRPSCTCTRNFAKNIFHCILIPRIFSHSAVERQIFSGHTFTVGPGSQTDRAASMYTQNKAVQGQINTAVSSRFHYTHHQPSKAGGVPSYLQTNRPLIWTESHQLLPKFSLSPAHNNPTMSPHVCLCYTNTDQCIMKINKFSGCSWKFTCLISLSIFALQNGNGKKYINY